METMISMAVFSVVILGSLGLMTFSLRNIDEGRTMAQVSRILSNEMEAMRMRGWRDRTFAGGAGSPATITLYGLKSLGIARREADNRPLVSIGDDTEKPLDTTVTPAGGGNYSYASTTYRVQPFAVYGSRNAGATDAATLGREIDTGTPVKLRSATGFTVTRTVTLKRSSDSGAVSVIPDVDYAEITVTATWTDQRGAHTRSLFTTLSKNGLSDFYYRSLPQ